MYPWEAEGLNSGGFSLSESWQSLICWAFIDKKIKYFLFLLGSPVISESSACWHPNSILMEVSLYWF